MSDYIVILNFRWVLTVPTVLTVFLKDSRKSSSFFDLTFGIVCAWITIASINDSITIFPIKSWKSSKFTKMCQFKTYVSNIERKRFRGRIKIPNIINFVTDFYKTFSYCSMYGTYYMKLHSGYSCSGVREKNKTL